MNRQKTLKKQLLSRADVAEKLTKTQLMKMVYGTSSIKNAVRNKMQGMSVSDLKDYFEYNEGKRIKNNFGSMLYYVKKWLLEKDIAFCPLKNEETREWEYGFLKTPKDFIYKLMEYRDRFYSMTPMVSLQKSKLKKLLEANVLTKKERILANILLQNWVINHGIGRKKISEKNE